MWQVETENIAGNGQYRGLSSAEKRPASRSQLNWVTSGLLALR
jgi:hypothetical protein